MNAFSFQIVNDSLKKPFQILQERLRSKFLKKGVTMIDPDTVYLSADTKIGKDVYHVWSAFRLTDLQCGF